MMASTPEKRKMRLSLKLKKNPKKEAEKKQEYRKLICAHFHFLPFVSVYSVFSSFSFRYAVFEILSHYVLFLFCVTMLDGFFLKSGLYSTRIFIVFS